MRVQYILTVQVPDATKALQVYNELQATAMDVTREQGVQAEGLKMRNVSLKEIGKEA